VNLSKADRKEFASLQAAFALRGHELTKTESTDGSVSYYACRWGLSRHLPHMEAVKAFLHQIGGRCA